MSLYQVYQNCIERFNPGFLEDDQVFKLFSVCLFKRGNGCKQKFSQTNASNLQQQLLTPVVRENAEV